MTLLALQRKPPSRRKQARSADNDPRRLLEPSPSFYARTLLAAKADFSPYSKHKRHPHLYGLKRYEGEDEDPTYCDEHAGFRPADIPRALPLLKRGIAAGLFGKGTKKGDPSLLWTVDDNGWIYEAQITNPGYGLYHAYPVLPNEAIAGKVLMRYANYVTQQNDPALDSSLDVARKRYQ